jgi:DNA-binding Lrp family transcriptional regulator
LDLVGELPKRLNQPENTVRCRIEWLLKNGVIGHFTVLIDPRTLRLPTSVSMYWMKFRPKPEEKRTAKKRGEAIMRY